MDLEVIEKTMKEKLEIFTDGAGDVLLFGENSKIYN